MPPNTDGVDWQSIKDFRLGIQQIVSPDHPPGTAQEDGTYRCFATSAGSLMSLPRRTTSYTRTPIVSVGTVVSEEFRTIGLHIPGPAYNSSDPVPGVEQNNDNVMVATEYWTAGNQHFEVARYTRNEGTAEWHSLWSATEAGTYSALVRPKHADFRDQRSNNTDPNQAGPSITAWVLNGHAYMFPDDTATTVDGTRYLPGDKVNDLGGGGLISPHDLEAHQGRLVIFPLATTGYGANQVYTHNECFFWTEVNDARNMDQYLAGNYLNVLAGYENPSGYGVIQSLSANELLLIKCRGGGLILRGDLEAFEAVTLPFLRSTGLSMNRGANSPIGFVYPVDGGGIWVWNGGSTSQELSPSMNPDFWRPDPVAPAYGAQSDTGWGHGYTQCAQWNQWVVIPNNWLFDTDTGAMWRLEDPDDIVYHRAAVNWRGRSCYVSPSGWLNDDDPVFYEYQLAEGASSWSWQSQPMSSTYERYTEVREVAVVAQGSGTVRVTVRSGENPSGSVAVFPVDEETRAVVIRQPVACKGSHITFQIESEAPSDTLEAPTVHELRWALRDGSKLGRGIS